MLTRSTLSDVVKYAQRTLAECTQFFCARGVPDFRKFCKFFARFLRNICVISTLDSRVILLKAYADSEKSCNEILRFAQPRGPSSRKFSARGAPKFFGNFAILSRELRAKFA